MAQEQKKRGRTSGMSVLLVLLLIIVGAAGAVGTLLLVGQGTLFGGKSVQAREKDEDHTGKVAVPISVKLIEPYTAVTKDHMIHPQTKDFVVKWIDEGKAKEAGFILGKDIPTYFGRVTKREKVPGYAFTESDFMPKGTRPGPASAVEKGMRGIWIDPAEVEGFEAMGIGDRFDMTATMPMKAQSANAGDQRFVSPDAARSKADAKAWDTSKRKLIDNGKVILPLPPDVQKRKGKKVFVQVSEAEADPLTDAIAVGAKLTVWIRGSQPGAGDTNLPEPERPPQMDSIEVIQGGKSTSVPVPAGGGQDEQPK